MIHDDIKRGQKFRKKEHGRCNVIILDEMVCAHEDKKSDFLIVCMCEKGGAIFCRERNEFLRMYVEVKNENTPP